MHLSVKKRISEFILINFFKVPNRFFFMKHSFTIPIDRDFLITDIKYYD